MSFWDNAKRAFTGRDEYYDEDERGYEETYDDYDEERPKRKLFSFLSRDTDDEYEDFAQEEDNSSRRSSARETFSSSRRTDSSPKSSIRYAPSLSGVEVTVLHPMGFDDSTKIVREVKEGRITIFDVSDITTSDEARRIIDYICGAAEGMECPFSRLCPSIFCIAPKGVILNDKKSRY